jgi:hypothetical protein
MIGGEDSRKREGEERRGKDLAYNKALQLLNYVTGGNPPPKSVMQCQIEVPI